MNNISSELQEKQAALEARLGALGGLGGAAVAFSGGVDSSFLLYSAKLALGDRLIAVTGRSLSFPQRELLAAQAFALEYGIRHFLVDSEELELEGFAENPPQRCYLCKKELFSKIKLLAGEQGLPLVLEASNLDDEGDYRPGLKAVAELGVVSPLREARLGKAEIRALSKAMGLSTWDKPSFACLASRFPYGERIDAERLRRIDAAENFLLELGFRQVRVRFHEQGKLARLELDEEGLRRLADRELRLRVHSRLLELGFLYIAADLLGYSSGSMNKTLLPLASPGT